LQNDTRNYKVNYPAKKRKKRAISSSFWGLMGPFAGARAAFCAVQSNAGERREPKAMATKNKTPADSVQESAGV
jgi:hypothetical protein